MSNTAPSTNAVSNGGNNPTTVSVSGSTAHLLPASSGAASGGGGGGKRFFTRIQGVFGDAGSSSGGSGGSGASGLRILIDKKFMERVYKAIEKIVKCCQQPRMNLKNSPPYILDTLPDIFEHLREIIRKYDENYEVLSDIEYFRIFMLTLLDKCKRTLKLFKEGKERMYDDTSQYRKKLTKFSLVFSHLLKDLEALFPSHFYASDSFRVTKQDAARWWASHFEGRSIVPWKEFKRKLFQSDSVEDPNQVLALQNTIDLTCNEHVSIFEFDVFVRLFQPWHNIIETWKALAVVHPGYMAFMTYDEVKAVLNNYLCSPGPGSYVYRLSCTKLGQWAIGYVTQDHVILQTIIQNKSLAQALLDGEREGFYKFPNGQVGGNVPDLESLVNNLPQVHIQVSQEQYQVYCVMGSTFELCKICAERDKDIRIEPCGHLLCRPCLHSWQSSGEGHSCPFCRREIKGTEEIVVDPYTPISVKSKSPSLATADLIDFNYANSASGSTIGKTSTTTSRVAPPPRPPRLAGAYSPAGSPGSVRRRAAPVPPTTQGSSSHLSADVGPTGESQQPSETSVVTSGVRVKTIDGNLNYAQLAFTDSDSDFEDLPPAPPPPPPVVGQAGSGSSQSGTGSDESGGLGEVGTGGLALELSVRALVLEGTEERVARRLLSITNNNLRMAREVLVWFVPKANI